MGRTPPAIRALVRVVCLLVFVVFLPDRAPANDDFLDTHPAGQFTLRVKWDGRYVVGITRVSGLIRRIEVVTQRGGGDPNAVRRAPGLTAYEPIVLERRLTQDAEFERWANKVWNYGSGLGAEVSLQDYRKDIRIELFNEAGEMAMAFNVYRCWPSDHAVIGEMVTDGSDLPTEVLVLQHEGWERDYAVATPH
ncbi:MAG: phage tail protein [Candidatus Eisenbacteria bacterium]